MNWILNFMKLIYEFNLICVRCSLRELLWQSTVPGKQ